MTTQTPTTETITAVVAIPLEPQQADAYLADALPDTAVVADITRHPGVSQYTVIHSGPSALAAEADLYTAFQWWEAFAPASDPMITPSTYWVTDGAAPRDQWDQVVADLLRPTA